ncbi:DUF6602 domain-containing protein [Maribacter halichondriae]|uniref:DUF6602 domain-containing protein n=1 Tax=Maribacter halichondriae TaxID=2980554 RepID=UPI0023584510|nr:DUF6602 domain-containing protein [Maribacter sp. Hal144]
MKKSNDLVDFMQSLTIELKGEYDRIQKRSTEDAATAGDQGEENWASIFRNWLPSDYQVVTKGRLMNPAGETSPQVDVVILYPWYPKALLDKKLFLTAGVVAEFECKNTLKASHIDKAVENSVKIKNLYEKVKENPVLKMFYYGVEHKNSSKHKKRINWKNELCSPVIYGLLAHSHSWKASGSEPKKIVSDKLIECDAKLFKHPRECLDFICVSDIATWYSARTPMSPNPKIDNGEVVAKWQPGPVTYYKMTKPEAFLKDSVPYLSNTPLGALLTELLKKLSIKDSRLFEISKYFSKALNTHGDSESRVWSENILSKTSRKKLNKKADFLNLEWIDSP